MTNEATTLAPGDKRTNDPVLDVHLMALYLNSSREYRGKRRPSGWLESPRCFDGDRLAPLMDAGWIERKDRATVVWTLSGVEHVRRLLLAYSVPDQWTDAEGRDLLHDFITALRSSDDADRLALLFG